MSMPRHSRRVVRQGVVGSFIGVEPLENHGTEGEVVGVAMRRVAVGSVNIDNDKFEPTTKGNSMLKEAAHALKHEREPRCLENYITGFLLMPDKASIRKYGDKAAAALLKEFIQLNNKETFKVTNPNNLTRL